MSSSDRAFRALARAEPEVIAALVRSLVPDAIPMHTELTTAAALDPHLGSLPPPIEADMVARIGDAGVLHLEFQGYRDTSFPERVVRYHLHLVLHHWGMRVRTVALWSIVPPRAQRLADVHVGDVTVNVTHVVLAEVPATLLLSSPLTACFAPGADAGSWSDEELCARVVATLMSARATWMQRHVAVVAALARGRYDWMVSAMDQAGMEPIVIEDLVKFGEDRGYERGEAMGEARVTRAHLYAVLESRGVTLSVDARARVDAEKSLDRLREWFARALSATSAEDVLD